MTKDVDASRRHFLGVATAVTGSVGAALFATPFLLTLKPSAKAQALGAPVEIPIGSLEPGEMVKVQWRGKPVWVLRRTGEMLERLPELAEFLRDPASEEDQQPEFAVNDHRSRNPEYLVVVGQCTHLGCSPIEQFQIEAADNWFGGFIVAKSIPMFFLPGRSLLTAKLQVNMPRAIVVNLLVAVMEEIDVSLGGGRSILEIPAARKDHSEAHRKQSA